MLAAAEKGYPVREIQKIPELRRFLTEDVNFFLKMVEADRPKVDPSRDPFSVPLRRKSKDDETEPDNGKRSVGPTERSKIPEAVQRDMAIRMKTLLVLIQQHLVANEEDQAREKWKEFTDLYRSVERKEITIEVYKKQMIETWQDGQTLIYPKLREIELKKFKEEAKAILDKLYEDYKNKDIDSARVHNEEVKKILVPKLKSEDTDFITLAQSFDKERVELFKRIQIIEDFLKSVRPFIKLTATITSPNLDKNIALIETAFGGEVKKTSLRENDALPRLSDFVIVSIEEDMLIAKYKGEEVEVPLVGRYGSAGGP